MPRSFAFLPAHAGGSDNIVALWHRPEAYSRRPDSIKLIGNLVRALCAPYANACVKIQGGAICVRGAGPFGIDIALYVDEGACTLWLGGWHDEMPDVDLALEYVARAIDGRLRVKVQFAGRRPRTWTVECKDDDGSWIEEAVTCGVRMWWHGTETTIYLRNAFMPTRRSGSAA